MRFTLPKIYPITDSHLSGLSHPEQVRRLIDGGAQLIQLRDKHASAGEFYDASAEAVELGRQHGVKIIINDRVDIAVAAGADGVHLGQDDLPPVHARGLLGQQAIIGFSTHSVEQAREAARLPIDYIAIGPVFGTTTKQDHDPVVGLDGVHMVRETIGGVPLVAIGGIRRSNARSVLDAGAASVAMISGLVSDATRIEAAMRELNDL